MKATNLTFLALALPVMSASAATETIAELELAADTTVTVAQGDVKHIEYLSGTAKVTLTKEGEGTLELAVVGNTNATFVVNGGAIRLVRPGKLALGMDDASFHVDGSDPASYTIQSVTGGTNFIATICDVDGRDMSASPVRATYYPYLYTNALNGLTVFDFGTTHGQGPTGTGAPMRWSRPLPPNEVFYIWADHDNARDLINGGYGPNPVCMESAGYRGTNSTAGTDFKLFRTSRWLVKNLYLDDEKADGDTFPGNGWHLFRTYSESLYKDADSNNYAGVSFGYRCSGLTQGALTPYGGCYLAEMVFCTNYLSAAKRAYVNLYLKRKWFGGYPLRRVFLKDGATLDVTAAPAYVDYLQKDDGATVNGVENLRVSASLFGPATNRLDVSGVYTAPDRSAGAIPNLAFQADGEIAVPSGTNAVNIAVGVGTFRKSGGGELRVGLLDEGFTAIDVREGTMALDPLSTPASALHVDAADAEAFKLAPSDGTNFVTIWEDVSRNGQKLTTTTVKYAFGEKGVVRKPFRVEGYQNGLPMVDFGTQRDAEHQGGWGAYLAVKKTFYASGGKKLTDECAMLQVFTVWEDHAESIAMEHLADTNGVVQGFVGPSIYGDGYGWNRGAGGAGTGFPLHAMSSPASVREEMWLDATRFYSQYVRFTPISGGVHLLDQKIGSTDGGISITGVGGNQNCQTTNGPYAAKGVFGGVRVGEVMGFRYYLPDRQRKQISAALGVKWFGTSAYVLKHGFTDVSVAAGTSLAFPYADVTVTNLTIAGTLAAKSMTVRRLDVLGDSSLAAPLAVSAGGTLALHGNAAAGIREVEAASVAFAGAGTLDLSDVGAMGLCGRSLRVVRTDSVSGNVAKWVGRTADGAVRAILEVRPDGVYANFSSNGMCVSFR